MKKKRILSVLLTFVMVFSITATPTMAATKASTKTITFGTNGSPADSFRYSPATIKVTNVTSQKAKDFSMYMSDDDKTISGEKSKVIYCKAPVTITLEPNKGEKNVGVNNFCMYFDSNKIKPSTVKGTYKYYTFDMDKYMPDFSEKFDTKPDDSYQIADGSTQKLTKAGTYVLYIQNVDVGDEFPDGLTPVFFVVK